MRLAPSSEITMGSAASPPAGPHCAVAAAFTLVRDGSPRTGANCRPTGAWYDTLTVPDGACDVHPWDEYPMFTAPLSLSAANVSACCWASLGLCCAQDWAAARAPASAL